MDNNAPHDSFDLLGCIPDAVVVVDGGYRVLFINEAAGELYGITRADAVGQPLNHVIELVSPDITRAEIFDAVRRTGCWRGEVQHRTRAVASVWLDQSVSSCVLDDGSQGFLAVMRKIDRYKEIETTWNECGRKYMVLLEESPDPIFSFSDAGQYLYVNSAFAEGVGKSVEDIVGHTIWEVFPKDEADRRFKSLSEVFQTLQKKVIEVRVPRADGDRYYVTTITPVNCPEGKRTIAICSSKEITERKKLEDALRESEASVRQKLKTIMEPDGDLGPLSFADILDVKALQELMNDFYSLTNIGIGVLDVNGNVLVGCGWQDICTKFHRVHPETLKNCIASDVDLANGVPVGTCRAYHCKNNLWDIMTPVQIAGQHVGNVCLGQFFYDDEIPDYQYFRAQARRYGFDEKEYLDALSRVPRFSHKTVDTVLAFYSKLAGMIASLGFSAVSLSRSLSQKDEASGQLARSEEQFRLLFRMSLDGLARIGADGSFLDANDAYCDMLGYTLDELKTKGDFYAITPRRFWDWERTEIWDNRLMKSGFTGVYEKEYVRKDGSVFPVEVQSFAVFDVDGKCSYVWGVVRDISERKRAEEERTKLQGQLQQAMKMEAVGRLAGGVAHDFNNLLTGILGNVSMAIADLESGDPVAKRLTEVNKAAQRAAGLTNQLLAFSRRQMIEPRVLDLNQTIASLQKMLVRLIGEHIEFKTVAGENLGAVKVDPGQFEQILVNLVVNARDAMPDGGRIVLETANVVLNDAWCREHGNAKPGPYVMLALTDTGCGMSDEVKSHLFEPFFTTKPQGQGTGLGLATIYGAVQQAGGIIDVLSEPGKGTTFTLYVPRVNEMVGRHDSGMRPNPMMYGHETILLVEDEPIVREIGVLLLQKLGYEVLSAEDGPKALKLAETHNGRIDLLFTDVVMPGMNGRELATLMIKARPGTRVLYTSGYTDDVIGHHGIVDDGLSFIGKPYSPADLASKIRLVLESGSAGCDAVDPGGPS